MNLEDYRRQIDEIDSQIVTLYQKRMEVVRGVAEYKRVNQLPVLQSGREAQVLDRVEQLAGPELGQSARVLFTTLMDLSKFSQHDQLGDAAGISYQLVDALPGTDQPIACQGVDGAYSSIACRVMFPGADIRFYPQFEDIFRAVECGACRYGVLPVENSTAGTVNAVYTAMKKFDLHIVKGLKLQVVHDLLAMPGTKLEQITDLYTHEQAIGQCSQFLKAHPHITPHLYSNTAAAAKYVAERGDPSCAAIACGGCAGLYGLQVLEHAIQDAAHNYTRFVVICRDALVQRGADKISISLTLPNEPGSLYRLLTHFAVLQLNITKLESRPIPGTDFEFLFYFDFEGSVYDPNVAALLQRLQAWCGTLTFLGNFEELHA